MLTTERALYRKSFGEVLKERRNALKLTLRELSEKTGVSVTTLSETESGKKSPRLETLEAWLGQLNVTHETVNKEATRRVLSEKKTQSVYQMNGERLQPA